IGIALEAQPRNASVLHLAVLAIDAEQAFGRIAPEQMRPRAPIEPPVGRPGGAVDLNAELLTDRRRQRRTGKTGGPINSAALCLHEAAAGVDLGVDARHGRTALLGNGDSRDAAN